MRGEEYRYLVALDVSPRDAETKLESGFVTELLGVMPTQVTLKGAKVRGGLLGRIGKRYDRWHWRFSTRWLKFDGTLSEQLMAFLQKLPKRKAVWTKLRSHCICRIYLPVERDYSLVEFELGPDASHELALRGLQLSVSTLTRT